MSMTTAVDSDEVPVAVLLQSEDDIEASYCGKCLRAAREWESDSSYHPCGSKPGAMFHAELYCAECMPRSYNDDGEEVRTFCGERHGFTDGEGYDCGCFD